MRRRLKLYPIVPAVTPASFLSPAFTAGGQNLELKLGPPAEAAQFLCSAKTALNPDYPMGTI
ncbi:MAG: hypothetical protein QM757_47390 [Paludibaculum sp.]